jgi:starch phosphorylase
MSLIGEDGARSVRMAHLATVGSHAVNGVAALHTTLLKTSVLRDFHELWPERFSNKTNGVTPRRFLALANPGLRRLITDAIGDGWISQLDELRKLEPFADDAAFRTRWQAVKRENKRRLAAYLERHTGVTLDPSWLFDIQVKRIHEYKRQHLAALHIASLYRRLKHDAGFDMPARAFVFGGKAAPGYFLAKRIVRLITAVAETVNGDPDVNSRLRVVFLPNFNVQNSHLVYPAADVSEQISMAGKEASGTGNMKFMMNGALTIGTLDGANVEIREEAGAENFFLFGLAADEVDRVRREGYRPASRAEADEDLNAVLESIAEGLFSRGDPDVFRPLVENLRHADPFLVLADYAAYGACQAQVDIAWRDVERWTRMSILNTARAGKFSSDRAIREYCDEIWNLPPVRVGLD